MQRLPRSAGPRLRLPESGRSWPDSAQSTPSSPSRRSRRRILERWRERDVFARSLAKRESAPLWGFYEGPPTANGRPGSHHVLARVFKDIYPRFRTMTGHRVPRKAGWDCHGLPVELEVEGELGITSKEEIEAFGIAEFNERCRESVFRYVEDWNRLTERIGFWIDLDDPYVTMTNEYIESVWWALRRMWDDGRLYEDYKVVPYCPRDGTALSSHEVALGYHDVEDPAVYVKLPVRDRARGDPGPARARRRAAGLDDHPWTLITNAAVAAGPEIEYVRARLLSGDEKVGAAAGDEVFVLARNRVEQVLGEDVEILGQLPRRGSSRTSPTSPPSTTSPTTARAATPSCSPTSSPPMRAPDWSTPRSRSGRTTSVSASSTGSSSRTRSTTAAASTIGSQTSPAAR